MSVILVFLQKAITQGIPLLLGANGEILTEKTGNLNLVWLAFPIAELMSLTMASIFLRKTMRRANRIMAGESPM